MTKVHLLGANKSYDRSVQTVSVNQVVVLEGYGSTLQSREEHVTTFAY